jgi:hypothetical protein
MAQHIFKYMLAAHILFGWSISYAAKILIVTDEPSQKKATDAKRMIEITPPFSLFKNLSITIRTVSKDLVRCTAQLAEKPDDDAPESCKKQYQIANSRDETGQDSVAKFNAQVAIERSKRLLICNTAEALMDIVGQENADKTIYIKDSSVSAGSGGPSSIVFSTSSPTTVVIHELLHSLGFADEYRYESTCEADTFCQFWKKPERSFNIAIFADSPPYESDSAARKKHASQIPWYGSIKPSTLITTGSDLGTPNEDVVGLFRAHVCDLAESKIKSWKPGGNNVTVMESLATNYIPEVYWQRIADRLGEKLETKNTSKLDETPAKGVH